MARRRSGSAGVVPARERGGGGAPEGGGARAHLNLGREWSEGWNFGRRREVAAAVSSRWVIPPRERRREEGGACVCVRECVRVLESVSARV